MYVPQTTVIQETYINKVKNTGNDINYRDKQI